MKLEPTSPRPLNALPFSGGAKRRPLQRRVGRRLSRREPLHRSSSIQSARVASRYQPDVRVAAQTVLHSESPPLKSLEATTPYEECAPLSETRRRQRSRRRRREEGHLPPESRWSTRVRWERTSAHSHRSSLRYYGPTRRPTRHLAALVLGTTPRGPWRLRPGCPRQRRPPFPS